MSKELFLYFILMFVRTISFFLFNRFRTVFTNQGTAASLNGGISKGPVDYPHGTRITHSNRSRFYR
jgi:hypothetical protein